MIHLIAPWYYFAKQLWLWLWMLMLTINFANLDLALHLVKLMTLNEHFPGDCPNFANHVGTWDPNDVEKSCPKSCKLDINIWGWTLLLRSIFYQWSEMYNRRKLDIQKFHQVFFPTYQELPSLEICTRSCDKIFQHNCQKNSINTACYEISSGRQSKTGVTPSSGVRCGWMTTCW